MIPRDPDSYPADHRHPEDQRLSDVGEIIQRLGALPANPVTRARLRVEQEVPPERRGPGWDRHWRELEAYADSTAEWQGGEPELEPEPEPEPGED